MSKSLLLRFPELAKKISLPVKFPIPPPFTAIWKTLACVAKDEFKFVAVHKSHEFANYVNKDFETNKVHGIENLI